MRDAEPQIYAALATLRNGYTQTQWARVQIFLVFNTVALPLLFGINSPEPIRMLVSFVGLGLHVAILQSTLRADRWIQFVDARMIELEELGQEDAAGIRVRVFSHPDFADRRQSLFASRKLFGAYGLAISLIWIWQSVGYIRQFLS